MFKRSVLLLLLVGLLATGAGSKVWARTGYSIVDQKRIYKYRNARASVTQPYALYVKKVDDKRPDYERHYVSHVPSPYKYTLDSGWLVKRFVRTTLEGQLTEVITEELRRSSIFQKVTNTPAEADYILDTLVKHCYGKYKKTSPIATFLLPKDDYAQCSVVGGTTLLVTLKKKDGTVVMQKEYSEEARGEFRANQATGWMYVMLGDSLEKCIEKMLKDVDTAMGGKGLAPISRASLKAEKKREKKERKAKKKKKKD